MQLLTEERLAEDVDALCKRDKDLGTIVAAFGIPPLWNRSPGFATMIHIILEQQVSLASALHCFKKLETALGVVTPEAFLTLDDNQLKTIGFSRQKTRYGRILAEVILSGELDFEALASLSDDEVRARLTAVTGIGDWTANIYQLMVLLRPDVWPRGDLALAIALREVKQLPHRPGHEEQLAIAENWRPYRAAAVRILWHHYLSTPRRRS